MRRLGAARPVGHDRTAWSETEVCVSLSVEAAESVENDFVCLAQPPDGATKRPHQIEETERTLFIPSV